jgi:hypothetical protein
MDDFENFQDSLTSPASAAEAITPSDDTALSHTTRGVFVGQGGDVTLRLISGDVVTLSNLQSGIIYPLRVDQVMATGTTATALVGLR